MTDLDGVKLDDAMSFFSTNVDSWGAAEWFDRLARAIRAQNAAVAAGDEVGFDTYRMIASSSAMRLVSDYEAEVRRALSPTPEAPAPAPALGSGETEWIGDFLNRRTDVEKVLRDVKRGKRQALSPEECWELADRLSVPANHGGA